jgi:DNA-binding HxlR family transcriptional regulator
MQLLEQKWTLQILRALSEGRKRFCGLQQAIGDVNSVTLTRRLRQMEEEAIVVREVLKDIPPWVEYELTEKGQELNAIVEAVERWGLKWASIGGSVAQAQPVAARK